jgi:predicted NBD/HSP70 family sugar kinase
MTAGVELLDSAALAVAVDDGAVRNRAVVEASGDLSKAAAAAVANLKLAAGTAVGVTTSNPEAAGAGEAAAALAERFGQPVLQSGVAAALAETWLGAAKGTADVVYFAVAEHVVAGIVREGRAMIGAHGRATSVAWLPLNPVEREDYRKMGCLEAEVAAHGIVRRLVWRIKAGDPSGVLDAVGNDLTKITVEHVLAAARAGDGVSISVMRDTAKYLGMAAANLVLVVDPTMLVLGGIMADAADLLLEPVRTEIARRLPRSMTDALAIATATLGVNAAAIGAARQTHLARR